MAESLTVIRTVQAGDKPASRPAGPEEGSEEGESAGMVRGRRVREQTSQRGREAAGDPGRQYKGLVASCSGGLYGWLCSPVTAPL